MGLGDYIIYYTTWISHGEADVLSYRQSSMTHSIVDAQNRGEEPRPSQLPKDLSKLAVDLNVEEVLKDEAKWNLNGLIAFQRAWVYSLLVNTS